MVLSVRDPYHSGQQIASDRTLSFEHGKASELASAVPSCETPIRIQHREAQGPSPAKWPMHLQRLSMI